MIPVIPDARWYLIFQYFNELPTYLFFYIYNV